VPATQGSYGVKRPQKLALENCWCGPTTYSGMPEAAYTETGPRVTRYLLGACFGSGGRIRTYDMAVNSRPLYH
jgi:hypothetical protein